MLLEWPQIETLRDLAPSERTCCAPRPPERSYPEPGADEPAEFVRRRRQMHIHDHGAYIVKTKTILLLLLAASLALGASGCGLIKGVLGGAAEEAGLGDLADAVLGADEDPTPAAEEEPESPTAPPAEATAEPAPEVRRTRIGELSPMEALDSYRSEFPRRRPSMGRSPRAGR